jgi:hypothetical protein
MHKPKKTTYLKFVFENLNTKKMKINIKARIQIKGMMIYEMKRMKGLKQNELH